MNNEKGGKNKKQWRKRKKKASLKILKEKNDWKRQLFQIKNNLKKIGIT